MTEFTNYINELQSEPIENITEHSKRSALEMLFKSIAKTANDKIKILHEPKRKENYGSPDFLMYIDNSIIGYVENKKITANLDKTIKTEQIKKYRELSDNILLTNYIEFVWIKKDVIERETLCYQSDLENKNFKPDSDKVQKVSTLITNFLSQAPIGVATTKELALALAIRSKNLKIYLLDELRRQEKEDRLGRLFGLFQTFKDNVSNDLELKEFADAFAQMLVYGLFLAKLNADTKEVTLRNAEEFIPQSFQLIRELVSFFDELEKTDYKETRWIIEETISIMNNLQLNEIQKTLSFNSKSLKQVTDPYIYFYEDFLAAYDSKLRKSKGVYYTPPQVVSFIVSSVNQILKDEFKISKGLAQHDKVTALDFATGTGTFLTEIFKQILESIKGNRKAAKELIIKDHLLKNIYGFEYLIAPYTITHLKLSQLLKDNDYELSENERLQVYLTNTLEPAHAKVNLFLPGLTEEGKLAKQIKENPVLIITGNPPYSNSSSNKDAMILNLLNDYKRGLNERKINLDDDYIKFIRFAHNKIARYGQGVVAVITNNSFLDGITHRRMRESLLNDFDKIYIINLHGNSLKKEGDENVFDIRVGVAISIFVKTPKPFKNKKVYYFSTKDNALIKRQEKYDFLNNNALNDVEFEELKPEKPNFWFVKKDLTAQKRYNSFWKIQDTFKITGSGIQTDRDSLFIDFDKNELEKRIKKLLSNDFNEDFISKYNINNSSSYNLTDRIGRGNFDKNKLKDVHYRVFDKRALYYDVGLTSRPAYDIMSHFEKENIGLIVCRQVNSQEWTHTFITGELTERCVISNKTQEANYIIPLYTFISNTDANGNGFLFKEEEKRDNFTSEFRKFIKTKYKKTQATDKKEIEKLKQYINNNELNIKNLQNSIQTITNELIIKNLEDSIEELRTEIDNLSEQILDLQNNTTENYYTPKPEQILGYIYAILHSPTYREKYEEFLKFDYPRIPFCETSEQFEKISKLGWQLIQVHLLKEIPSGKKYENLAVYVGEGKNVVEKPEYKNNKLYINKDQYFDNIPKSIYDFKIGAYQILHKYLKDRKGRTLTYDEIVNVENISKSLKFTISQMKLIDKEVHGWI